MNPVTILLLATLLMAPLTSIDAKPIKSGNTKRPKKLDVWKTKSPTPSPSVTPPDAFCGDVRRDLLKIFKQVRGTKPPVVAVTATTNPFTSTFYVAYGGPTGVFDLNATSTVQTVLRDTYNDVVACDQGILFDNVTISDQIFFPPGERRRLRSFSLVNTYRVTGTCRSCSNGVKLFNDAVRRLLQAQIQNFNMALLQNLVAAGINEVTSVSVSNGIPVDNTTIAPSDPPTMFPTVAPTFLPTAVLTNAPSQVPTAVPTNAPSQVPTAVPTNAPSKVPTAVPTYAPSQVPTAVPTNAPSQPPSTITLPCDDSETIQFLVDVVVNVFGTTEKRLQKCIWLAARIEEQSIYCKPDHLSGAYDICPETCRKCFDSCTENRRSEFLYNNKIKNCAWLSIRFDVQDKICVPGQPAYDLCTESCNSCPGPGGGYGAALPISPHVICDDTDIVNFLVDDVVGFQNCSWLRYECNPVYRNVLCNSSHPSNAYGICEETCGKCTDNCVDSTNMFTVNGTLRDCHWLTMNRFYMTSQCKVGQPGYNNCPETCGVCD